LGVVRRPLPFDLLDLARSDFPNESPPDRGDWLRRIDSGSNSSTARRAAEYNNVRSRRNADFTAGMVAQLWSAKRDLHVFSIMTVTVILLGRAPNGNH